MGKSIIDKLELKTIESLKTLDPDGNVMFRFGTVKEVEDIIYPQIRELENQRNEILEDLINGCLRWEKERFFPNDIYRINIEIIEKASNKTWKEIKALLEQE